MTIDKALSRPFYERICTGDVGLLLEHYSFLSPMAKIDVGKTFTDLENSPHSCKQQGVNYNDLTSKVEDSTFSGEQRLFAAAIKLYLLSERKSTT